MRLPRSTPEQQCVDSQKILQFYEAVKERKHGLHSFMLVKNGHVISEGWWKPYAPDLTHQLFSLSKSFTSTAVGMAVGEGLLTVADPVEKFFPEEMEALDGRVDDKLARMTVRHLLTMSTGQTYEPWPENFNGGFVKSFLQGHIRFEPGSVFSYNTNATFMLSAIIQKLTGKTLTEYLYPRLFEPLGISEPYWESCSDGIDFGGFGLNLTTEAIAKFGLLYLQKGKWQGTQLIAESWVSDATGKQIETRNNPSHAGDWAWGYGYQFWQCSHNAYRGDGAFGQFCLVMPEAETVVAITSNADMQQTMDLIWEYILPACKDGCVSDGSAYQALRDEQTRLVLPGWADSCVSAGNAKRNIFNGKNRAVYDVRTENANSEADITKIALEYHEARQEVTLALWFKNQACPSLYAYRFGQYVEALNPAPYGERLARMAARMEWEDDKHVVFHHLYLNTPFTITLRCELTGDGIKGVLEMPMLLSAHRISFESVPPQS